MADASAHPGCGINLWSTSRRRCQRTLESRWTPSPLKSCFAALGALGQDVAAAVVVVGGWFGEREPGGGDLRS